jgi:hypothetical protein
LEGFLPDDAVVALCERRAADFAMVPPDRTLGGDDVFAEDIEGSVEIYGLGEVDASGGDLADGFCVCHGNDVLAWSHDDERITA